MKGVGGERVLGRGHETEKRKYGGMKWGRGGARVGWGGGMRLRV